MKGKRILIWSFFVCLITVLWGVEQGRAAPILNPAVDLSKPNYAYSPTTIKKFVDSLPGLNTANNLQQQLPLATADTTTFPGSDYYEIALVEYVEQMHTNLPPVVGA